MATQRGKRGRKLEAAVAALLSAKTIADAAKVVGVTERTLRMWMKTPAFLGIYRQVRRQVVEHALTRMQQATAAAVDALERNLTCRKPAAEVRAAAEILERATKGIELWDLV